jgi:glycosyltransferase involved in cell wall biosynthesis
VKLWLPWRRACRRLGLALEFRVHLVNELLTPAEFEDFAAVAEEPGVTVVRGPLGRRDYLRLLAESDLLLLPYGRLPYRQRGSGTLAEAVGCGMPVVVPDGTWAAEQVEEGKAAGVIYEGDDAEAIAGALGHCAAAIEPLRALACALAPSWRRMHSTAAFLDWMEGEIVARSLEPTR